MTRATVFLRRALGVMFALAPLLAGADLCTLGAVTGRAELACPMEAAGPATCAAAAPAPGCSHCAPAAPVKETPRSQGPTCCDLRPEADGAAGQPGLSVPLPEGQPAWASPATVSFVAVVAPFGRAPEDGRAPPADLAPPAYPRGPPLG